MKLAQGSVEFAPQLCWNHIKKPVFCCMFCVWCPEKTRQKQLDPVHHQFDPVWPLSGASSTWQGAVDKQKGMARKFPQKGADAQHVHWNTEDDKPAWICEFDWICVVFKSWESQKFSFGAMNLAFGDSGAIPNLSAKAHRHEASWRIPDLLELCSGRRQCGSWKPRDHVSAWLNWLAMTYRDIDMMLFI